MTRKVIATIFLLAYAGLVDSATSQRLNGFLIDEPLVPADLIQHGGPPRDGIPAINSPRFIAAANADFLKPSDRVLGISIDGDSKAYPVRILNYHEVVNDWFNEQPVAITYCPLCGSGVAFSARIADKELSFGVSGLLYNSDVLLYDRETMSLWSQIAGKAVNGPLKGSDLQQIPVRHTSWQDWRQRNPDTLVMSTQTGFARINYHRDPYADYRDTNRLWFAVGNTDRRLSNKAWVLGVVADDRSKAYPLRALKEAESPLHDQIGGVPVTIQFDNKHQTAIATDQEGNHLESIQLYWFAWAAFHPDTAIWKHDN